MTVQEKATAVNEYIAQTTGTGDWYRHWAGGLIYTDGVLFVAETCGAHWLIDLIASHQRKPKLRRNPFQVWQLTKEKDGTFAARCWDDTPGESNRLVTQKFDYSDFPDDLLPFTLWLESGTLLLPAEH
jgi:hypothetical protein